MLKFITKYKNIHFRKLTEINFPLNALFNPLFFCFQIKHKLSRIISLPRDETLPCVA